METLHFKGEKKGMKKINMSCSILNPEHAFIVSARQVSDRKSKIARVGARKIVFQLLLSKYHSELQLSILRTLGSILSTLYNVLQLL